MTKPNLLNFIAEERKRINEERLVQLPLLIENQRNLLKYMDKYDPMYQVLERRLSQNIEEYQQRMGGMRV